MTKPMGSLYVQIATCEPAFSPMQNVYWITAQAQNKVRRYPHLLLGLICGTIQLLFFSFSEDIFILEEREEVARFGILPNAGFEPRKDSMHLLFF